MSMRYRRRKIWLILIWIFLFIIVSFATLYYGYARSVDAATDTIRTSLQKVDGSIEDLISDEIKIRNSYEQTHASMGEMVPFLQEHDLEKTVPDRDHLETYQDLLEANYIAVIDPEGKTAVSSGKLVPDKHNVEISTEEGLLAWMTSAHVLVPAEEDYTTVEIPLKDDYTLRYQISNEEANIVQNEVFSWRVVLRDMTLPNEAYFVVISKKDDTILVHPDKDKIGASYDAIGFKSKKDFLNTYVKPDNDGISYQKDMSSLLLKGKKPRDLLYSEINLMGKGSGYMEMQDMYVICNMPEDMSVFFALQQRGVLTIYMLASLLVLCYILFRFRWQKRQETGAQGKAAAEDSPIGNRFGFFYDRVWSRRLIVCCIIVLVVSALLAVHLELLSNSSQMKIQANNAKQMTKEVSRENEKNRSVLDEWFNSTNIQMAKVISYTLTRDDELQTRDTIKEVSEVFDVPEVYLFSQNGKMRVTNSDFDHIDLNGEAPPRMAWTFRPLLYGLMSNASTSTTQKDLEKSREKKKDEAEKTDSGSQGKEAFLGGRYEEDVFAYAGVSIRNGRDICDGALGLAVESLTELWENNILSESDTFTTMLNMAEDTGEEKSIMLSMNQMALIGIMMFFLLLCLAVFFALAVLRRNPPPERPENDPADVRAAETDDNSSEKETAQVPDDLFYSLYGKKKDLFFNKRWNYDGTPLRDRTPEKQLFFVIRCILFFLFLNVVMLFLTRNFPLGENSMLRDVVSGGWEPGINLYAITATEMIIIVAVVLCMCLRRLIYFAARFSTARGETVCHLVYSMIMYAAVLVAMYYSLSLFGVHAKTILAGAGILGIVISFGAQSTIADILSGMFLIFEDVIHVGDFVKVDDSIGIVKSIGVRMTKIQSYGTEISINNADLKSMRNLSSADAMVTCYIPIDYREDLARVEKIVEKELPDIKERMDKTGYIKSDIWYSDVSSLNENGVILRFDVFCVSYRFGVVQRRLNAELLMMCQRNNIKTAVGHTYLENVRASAKAGEVPAQIKPPEPVQKEAPQDRRKGFIDNIIDKMDK